MKRRIVHVVPHLRNGGAEQMAVHLVCALPRYGYKPSVIVLGGRFGTSLESMLEERQVPVTYLGKGSGFHPRIVLMVNRELQKESFDVLHTHVHVLRYVMPGLLWNRRYPVVHTVHNIAECEVEPRAQWLQKFAFTQGVLPIACSKEVSISLRRRYGIAGVEVIPNGIPVNRYGTHPEDKRAWREKEKLPADAVVFTCVALFRPQKNHGLLLESFAAGLAGNPRARLVLAGTGSTEAAARAQAQKLGVADRVHFLGLRDDVPKLLSASDVFVLSSDYEGNPLALMEAMAAGLPVISTTVGGVPELVCHRREGLLVERNDKVEFSKAMSLLGSNEQLRCVMGRQAMIRAQKNFDLQIMVEAYCNLYDRLTTRSQSVLSVAAQGAAF